MEHDLQAGDFLVFQLEAGFALLRLLAIDQDQTWHVAAYSDLFPRVDAAEEAIGRGEVKTSDPHIALTQRAFESTQVARVGHRPLSDQDLAGLVLWRNDPDRAVRDRSIRLLLGLR